MKEGWSTKKLGDVLEIQNGYAFNSKEFNPSKGMPLVRIRSLKAGNETETRFHGNYDKKYVVKAGDLLIGMDGEFGCYEWKGEPALLNQRVCRLHGFSSELLPRFLFYGVNDHLKEIEDATGYATVKHLSSKQILGIDFPIPPLSEQHRLVSLLDEAFAGIATGKENAEKNLENARAIFESELNAIFTQRGEGWVEKKLEDVLAVQPQNGWSPPAANHADSGTPVLTLSSVTGFVFRPDKVKFTSAAADPSKRYWVENGDFLITRSNTPELVGHVAIAFGLEEPTIYPDLIMRMNPDPTKALTEFLYYQMRTPALREEISGRAQGANPTMKKISNGAVRTLPIFVPPLAEQYTAVTQLDALATETQRLASIYERKLAELDALKKSLLHHAFTGQL